MGDLVILDTNSWIYLCNAHPFEKDENGYYPHIKMFNLLKDLVNDKDVTILTNDLIIDEWNRNKEAARAYIKRLEGQKIEKSNRIKKKDTRENIEEVAKIREQIDLLDKLIIENEQHLLDVEKFLFDKTVKYPITDESKVIAANQAIDKKAPFTGKKSNSMADMVILLSGIIFIKNNYAIEVFDMDWMYPNCYFVSGNKNDFSSKENENFIHRDLFPFLDMIKMDYYINLGEFINRLLNSNVLTNLDIQNYNDFVDGEVELCPHCDENLDPYVHFNKKVLVRDENAPLYDDKQLRLGFVQETTDELNKGAYIETYEGSCDWCGGRFIQCAVCGEMLEINMDGHEQCEHCGATYTTSVEYQEKDTIYDLRYTLLKESE